MSFVDHYRRWFSRVAATPFARNWLGPKVIARLDRRLYTGTGGGLISLGSRAYPTLLLTTTGHRTGRLHTVPLFFLQRGNGLLVVASNYGRVDHPGWSTNLLHEPACHVRVQNELRHVRARLLGPEEKGAVWPELVDVFDGWQRYEEQTARSIRVFSLEPA